MAYFFGPPGIQEQLVNNFTNVHFYWIFYAVSLSNMVTTVCFQCAKVVIYAYCSKLWAQTVSSYF